MNKKDSTRMSKVIKSSLEEDIKSGDITTLATVKKKQKATAEFLVKENGIIAGLSIAKKVFKQVDPKLRLKIFIKDGSTVKHGDVIAVVEGKASSILTAERTALNFLQRMSGIATATFLYQEKIKHTKAKIIDTRKTAPGLRLFDKMAVNIGGAENHRMGLYDGVLIKDNHIAVCGGIANAVEKARQAISHLVKVEVEAATFQEVASALSAGADIIMLDNMDLDQIRQAVRMIDKQALVEVSGGVTRERLLELAQTGVDLISIGALTHSAVAVDLSMRIEAGN